MYLRSGEGIPIIFSVGIIVRDPEADSGGKGKSERAEKNCAPFFSACLDFLLPPLSAPGSPRMIRHQQCSKQNLEFQLVIWASSSLKGAVSRRNSAKLGNYKITVTLRET